MALFDLFVLLGSPVGICIRHVLINGIFG